MSLDIRLGLGQKYGHSLRDIKHLPEFEDCSVNQLRKTYMCAKEYPLIIALIDALQNRLWRVDDQLNEQKSDEMIAIPQRQQIADLKTALREQSRMTKLLLGDKPCCLCQEDSSDDGPTFVAIGCSNKHFMCMGDNCLPKFVLSPSRDRCPLCKENIEDEVARQVCIFKDLDSSRS